MLKKIDNKKRVLLTSIDLLISKKIKIRRKLLGIPQHELAKEIDLSVQQIQKYESGKNRISAGKLYDIAHCLKTPIEYFFNNKNILEDPVYLFPENDFIDNSVFEPNNSLYHLNEDSELLTLVNVDKLTKNVQKDILVLIKGYLDIADEGIRKTIIDLVKNINNK